MTAEQARRAKMAAERYRANGQPIKAAYWDRKAEEHQDDKKEK